MNYARVSMVIRAQAVVDRVRLRTYEDGQDDGDEVDEDDAADDGNGDLRTH